MWTISPQKYPGVFLRIASPDKRDGVGVVNLRWGGAGEWERFRLIRSPQWKHSVRFESAAYPGLFLAMNRGTMNSFSGTGGGKVYCKFDAPMLAEHPTDFDFQIECHGEVTPRCMVLNVFYAPPGSSGKEESKVEYSTGFTAGSIVSTSKSFGTSAGLETNVKVGGASGGQFQLQQRRHQ